MFPSSHLRFAVLSKPYQQRDLSLLLVVDSAEKFHEENQVTNKKDYTMFANYWAKKPMSWLRLLPRYNSSWWAKAYFNYTTVCP